MHALPFLQSLVILLAAAVIIIVASRPLRLPGLIGFLLTGILIGPFGLKLIPDHGIIEVFAEFGVVMLLFFIGLEFSLANLRRIGRQLFLGGGLQVGLTTIVVMAGLWLGGWLQPVERLFLGFVVALSSTAIILRMLSEKDELDAPHGRLSIGVSLFQDFCIIPIIALTPILAGQGTASLGDVFLRFTVSVVAIGVIFLLARRLMPRILRSIAGTRVREVFLFGSLLACFAMAEATFQLGFSYALGAFVAGIIISESEYSHEVIAEIVPFRDFFSSLFFVSVGMLLDLDFVRTNLPAVVAAGVGVIVVKACVVFTVARLLSLSIRTSVLAAILLGQIGEFSFVLFNAGQSSGLLRGELYQYFLGAAIFSMAVTPPFFLAAPWVGEKLRGALPDRPSRDTTVAERALRDHVIIVGYGLNGRNIARVLTETGIPFIVLESDGYAARRASHDGIQLMFGDAAKKNILVAAGIQRARVLVVAISDHSTSRTVIALARILHPELHIVVRTRGVSEVEELTRLGANEVIPEEFETSIEIFTRVLDRFHIPRNVINAQIKVIRDENYGVLRGLPQTARGLEKLTQILAAGTSDTFLVTSESRASGTTVGFLRLSEETGVMLIAIVRGDTPQLTPPPEASIAAGDILVLVGTHANMDRAFDYLSGPGGVA